jgi:diguanylate cyclase (GGDEF)-like protein
MGAAGGIRAMNSSLFVRADRSGLVTETFWSSPISLALPYVTNLAALFKPESSRLFIQACKEAEERREGAICGPLSSADNSELLTVLLCSSGEDLWVLSAEYTPLAEQGESEPFINALLKLLASCARIYSRARVESSQEVGRNFEQIQKLNNELINTQRRLQQANRQLEILNEELNNRLVKDPLTDLVSRYQYRSEILRVISEKPEAEGFFMFIDIDNFKEINDTYGHSTGDTCLVEFSRRLVRVNLGYPAICMRIAGDEFGIYMHGTNLPATSFARSFWQQFSRTVIGEPIETEAGLLPLSCSAGLAVYNRDTANIYELIDYADWAMYTAKRSGRNTFRIFSRESYDQRPAAVSRRNRQG